MPSIPRLPYRLEKRLSFTQNWLAQHRWLGEIQSIEQRPPGLVGKAASITALEQQVEDDVVGRTLAQEKETRGAVVIEGDDLTVENDLGFQSHGCHFGESISDVVAPP